MLPLIAADVLFSITLLLMKNFVPSGSLIDESHYTYARILQYYNSLVKLELASYVTAQSLCKTIMLLMINIC